MFCSEMWLKCVFVQIWKALVTKSILLKRIELHRTKVWSCSTFHITCSPLWQFYNHFSIQIIGNLKCSGKRISQDRLIYTFQQSKQGGYIGAIAAHSHILFTFSSSSSVSFFVIVILIMNFHWFIVFIRNVYCKYCL